MKIELCDNSSTSLNIFIAFLAFFTLVGGITYYHTLPFREGYEQKQLEASQLTLWVKPGTTNSVSK